MLGVEIVAISRDRRCRFRHLSHRPRHWGRFLYRCPLRSRFEEKVDEAMVYGLRPAGDNVLVRTCRKESERTKVRDPTRDVILRCWNDVGLDP